MEFFAARSNYSAEMKALIEQVQCLPFGAFVGFLFTHQDFDLSRYEATDGGGASGGDNLSLLDRFAIKANR
jgi:hypothetical protein